MSKYFKSITAGVFALAMMTTTALAEKTVGLLLPYSGVFAALGNDIDTGFVIALEESKMSDKIKIVREDTEVKPQVGLSKARKLAFEDNVDVIVGVVSSGVLGAMRDFIHNTKVPLIVANAGNNHATGKDCSPYITRVSFSNAQPNRPMGKWVYDQGVRNVYIMAADYAAGHQTMAAFKNAFTGAGGKVIGEEYTPFRKTKDFGPYLTKARQAGPDAIYVFYAGGEAIAFVKQYASFGIKDSIPLYSSGFLTSPLYVNAQGDAAVGVITGGHYVPTISNRANKRFIKAYGAKKDGKGPSEFAVQGYDAGRVLAEALKSGAKDRESIAKALPKVKYSGPRGPLEIDPKTNNIVQNIYVYETVKGDNGLTQKVLSTVKRVQDQPNGCTLG